MNPQKSVAEVRRIQYVCLYSFAHVSNQNELTGSDISSQISTLHCLHHDNMDDGNKLIKLTTTTWMTTIPRAHLMAPDQLWEIGSVVFSVGGTVLICLEALEETLLMQKFNNL